MANSLIWDTPILAITSSPLIIRIASSQGWSLYPAVLHSFFYDRPCVLVNRNAILFFQLTVSSVRVSELADWAYVLSDCTIPEAPEYNSTQ